MLPKMNIPKTTKIYVFWHIIIALLFKQCL